MTQNKDFADTYDMVLTLRFKQQARQDRICSINREIETTAAEIDTLTKRIDKMLAPTLSWRYVLDVKDNGGRGYSLSLEEAAGMASNLEYKFFAFEDKVYHTATRSVIGRPEDTVR